MKCLHCDSFLSAAGDEEDKNSALMPGRGGAVKPSVAQSETMFNVQKYDVNGVSSGFLKMFHQKWPRPESKAGRSNFWTRT